MLGRKGEPAPRLDGSDHGLKKGNREAKALGGVGASVGHDPLS